MAVEEETWRAVRGSDRRYWASSLGKIYSTLSGKVVLGHSNGQGHLKIWILGKRQYIHRLVCEAFHGPAPEDRPLVLHWDDDPSNNQASNLRWGSKSDNMVDRVRNGNNPSSRRTHCPQNHPLEEPNLRNAHAARGVRQCKACHRAYSKCRTRGIKMTKKESDREYDKIMQEYLRRTDANATVDKDWPLKLKGD